MEVRTSRLFKQQVAELFRYLKVTFGKRIAVSVRDEIKEQLLRLKEFPQMGAVESQLEGEPEVYRYLIVRHNKILYTVEKILYTVEADHVFVYLLWDCRQEPRSLWNLLKETE